MIRVNVPCSAKHHVFYPKVSAKRFVFGTACECGIGFLISVDLLWGAKVRLSAPLERVGEILERLEWHRKEHRDRNGPFAYLVAPSREAFENAALGDSETVEEIDRERAQALVEVAIADDRARRG